jgi:hypothetical protein
MSVRILAAAAVLTFFAALLVVVTRPSTSKEVSHEVAAVEIDFNALRAEAAAALQALEQSRGPRFASTDAEAF